MTQDMRFFLNRVATGEPLSPDEMTEAMSLLLSGKASDIEIAGLLMGLRVRGVTPEELAAAVKAMRDRALHVDAPEDAIDTCGTGGDGADTFNISTAVALVAAGAGASVAKHGSTAASSRSGSAEVLRELGVKLDAEPEVISDCIREAGVGFMFAAVHHGAVKNVMPARRGLGVRTMFNLLGPLSNPAQAKRQLMGVYDEKLLLPIAETMVRLGIERAWVVHGADGLDELSTTGENKVAEVKSGKIATFNVSPENAGLPVTTIGSLKGGEPQQNAEAIARLLAGEEGAFRNIVLLNTAAALVITDKAPDLPNGVKLASAAIDSGAARQALDNLVRISNKAP